MRPNLTGHLAELEGIKRRLDKAIEMAKKYDDGETYQLLMTIKTGGIFKPVFRRSNLETLYAKEAKMKTNPFGGRDE